MKKENSPKKLKPQDVDINTLNQIGKAFNNNDIDQVMSFFDKNAVFNHASGPDLHGKKFEGYSELKEVFNSLFKSVKSVQWQTIDQRISGDKAYCEYRRKAIMKNGKIEDFHSIDVLTFKKGLIIYKDTYYKNKIEVSR